MRRSLFWFLLAVQVAAVLAVLLQAPGANGPTEWRWEYRELGLHPWVLPVAAAILVVITASGWAGRWKGAARLAALVLLGWLLTLAVAHAQPGGLHRVVSSLVSRQSFSFVFDAGVLAPTRDLLADYPAALSAANLHTATHPPGAILLVRAIDAAVGTLRLPDPAAGDASLAATARDALEQETDRARRHHRPAPPGPARPWGIVVLALLLPLLSALAAWPLYRLALTWNLSPEQALFAAGLWLLVPARSLFTPSLDQALPALGVTAAALAAAGGPWGLLGGGALLWLCCMTSYGYLPLVPIVVVLAAVGVRREGATRGSLLRQLSLLLLSLAVPALALWALAGFDPIANLRLALDAHDRMAVGARGYALWLAWNPYDFALHLGPAVLGLGIVRWRRGGAERPGDLRWAQACVWGVLLLLLVAGAVRGEVGRIWLLFMPFICLFAAAALEDGSRPKALFLGAQATLLLALAASMIFVS